MVDREGFNKFIGLFVLLIILTILKSWLDYSYVFIWLGVIVGYYLPFIDHLFYAFILRPDREVSKNIKERITVKNLFSWKKMRELVTYVNETKNQREKLVIHTAYFQIVFSLLAFYILSSSNNIFGRGLVYGFALKLLIEQVLYFINTKELNKWFSEIPVQMDFYKTRFYLYSNAFILLIFTFML